MNKSETDSLDFIFRIEKTDRKLVKQVRGLKPHLVDNVHKMKHTQTVHKGVGFKDLDLNNTSTHNHLDRQFSHPRPLITKVHRPSLKSKL